MVEKETQLHSSKVNDLLILFMAFLYLIPIFFSENIYLNAAILILAFLNILLLRRINFKYLLYFLLIIILPIFSVFITVLIYTKGAGATPVIGYFLGFAIRELAFENALFLTVRAFSLSMISFIFLLAIKYDALVFSLMQNLKLPVSIGYALLATFNAFNYMKDEFLRIQLAYKMRFLKLRFPLSLIFPILVSASRHAHYTGLSLESRGLNSQKTFSEYFFWKKKDTLVLFINIVEIVLIVSLFIIKGWLGIRLS